MNYDVTYGEDGTITNTYDHSDIYSYRVDRVYNYYVDGTLDSTNTVTGTCVTGEKDETVTISDADKDSYKQTDGRSEYTFVSGGPVLEDGTTIGVTLDEANLEYVITLTYEYRYTTPDEPGGGGRGDRTVTVYYREEGTRDQLADTEQREYDYGDAWDVTDLTDLDIDGYVITRVEGDTSGDRLTSNKTVTVWYSNDETDIEDPDTPTTDLPDGGDTGDTGDTGNTGGETDIGDEDVPLAEAPETGDASLLWVILAIASGIGMVAYSKMVSVGSLTGGAMFLLLTLPFGADPWVRLLALLACLLIVLRHWENIYRIRTGQENRISFKKKG